MTQLVKPHGGGLLKPLLLEDDAGVRVLTLNRPRKKNAVNPELAEDLTGALHQAAGDEAVRVVVVRGAGDAYCAGADLSVFLAIGRGEMEGPQKVGELHRQLRAFPKPLIAAVHGQAVGMGVTLLPHYDMVYAADDASFTTPFVRLGLVLEFGSSFTLPRLIGRQRANEPGSESFNSFFSKRLDASRKAPLAAGCGKSPLRWASICP